MAADPRHLILADLTGRLAAELAGRARAYETAAEAAEGALRSALQDLGRAKHAQSADLAPLARALGLAVPATPPGVPPAKARAWGVLLGEAFQGERTLEEVGRELAGLTADPAVRALGLRLATAAARDGEVVRKLYLRYS